MMAQLYLLLPHADFTRNARVFSDRHLRLQRESAYRILAATLGYYVNEQNQFFIIKPSNRPKLLNHSFVKMWMIHQQSLYEYIKTLCIEWELRNNKDHVLDKCNMLMCQAGSKASIVEPRWLGHPNLHASHKSALLAMDTPFYRQYGWRNQAVINYWWPDYNKEIR